MLVLLLALAGCTADSGPTAPAALPSPANLPDLGLHGPAAAPWRGIDALSTARIELPAPSSAAAVTGVFTLDQGWSPGPKHFGRLRTFTTPLPFANDMPRPNYAPYGARMYRGETEVPYINDPTDIRGMGWLVDHDQIVVLTMEDPTRWREPAALKVPELVAEAKKRRWSGGDPATFVRGSVTVDGVTRPGLHLPAGGSVTFPVKVPADARLDFGLVAMPPLLTGEGSSVATVAWAVDGEDLGTAKVMPGAPPEDHVESLARWAGKDVSLTFRVDPSAELTNVLVTAPTISTPNPSPRHVVVVGIDTLRRDALGVYGSSRATSPELDAWAAQSVVFDDAWAPAPRTRPSFRTALTGRYPFAAAAAPTLAEHLSAAGFRTAGVVANVHLVPRFGFNDGFEHWAYENGQTAETQLARALDWQTRHADEDTFLFVHLMDPHTFYNAPDPYGSKFHQGTRPARLPKQYERWQIYQVMKQPWFDDSVRAWVRADYDGEVAYTSAMLGRFFGDVEKLAGRTLTVLHSDHGEEFWDHGAYEHNHTLYQELTHAALWIRAPGGQSSPSRVTAPAGLVDIVPTILDLVGAPPAESDGRSLAAFVDPTRASERASLATALEDRPLILGHLMFGRERWGVVWHDRTYILHTATGQEELYDLTTDPTEQKNLSSQQPESLVEMRDAMARGSGWPVRPGWRVRLEGPPSNVVLHFDAPIAAADVLDPEAERESRANLEWGEKPETLPRQVGTVTLEDEGRTVRFVGGPRMSGHQFWVACAGDCPSGTVEVGDQTEPLADQELTFDALKVDATPGTLLTVPDVKEEHDAAAADQREALEALGYLHPD